MRFSANYVYTGNNSFLKNGIIEVNSEGRIIKVIDTQGAPIELSSMQYFNGILVPGFVNTHCHLELSHLKDKLPTSLGMRKFIETIPSIRQTDPKLKAKQIKTQDAIMFSNGIKAVADISNTCDTIAVKKESPIFYHSFMEVFGIHPAKAEAALLNARTNLNAFQNAGLSASITPHASYSLSQQLWDFFNNSNQIISIHNQESKAEKKLFGTKSGDMAEFVKHISPNTNIANYYHKESALKFILNKLNPQNKTLFVHNVFTTEEDIAVANEFCKPENLYWSFCPNSNIYIEGEMPNLSLFLNKNQNITIGTDSLASNTKLSVLAELITIQEHFPKISLDKLLDWATINGANFLGLEKNLGTIEPGKKPGLNLITGVDLHNLKLRPDSKVKVIL